MDGPTFAALAASLGLGVIIPTSAKAWIDRRKTSADATSVLTAAARELVEPLRVELAAERASHAHVVEQERTAVRGMRAELDSVRRDLAEARREAAELRAELHQVRADAHQAHAEAARWQGRAHELERMMRKEAEGD